MVSLASRPLDDRFWEKVTEGPGGCWLWTGSKNRLGYGHIHVAVGERRDMAHRRAWTIMRGDIPEGLELDHLCRVPSCVNPDHLEPVTHAENMRRAPWSAVDFQRSKTHCPRGHPYTADSALVGRGRVKRQCVTCYPRRRRSG